MTFPQKDKNATRRSFFMPTEVSGAAPAQSFRPWAHSLARIILTGLTLRSVIAAVSARI